MGTGQLGSARSGAQPSLPGRVLPAGTQFHSCQPGDNSCQPGDNSCLRSSPAARARRLWLCRGLFSHRESRFKSGVSCLLCALVLLFLLPGRGSLSPRLCGLSCAWMGSAKHPSFAARVLLCVRDSFFFFFFFSF